MRSLVVLQFKSFMFFAKKSLEFPTRWREFQYFKCFSSCAEPSLRNDPASLAALLTLPVNSESWARGSQIHGYIIMLGFSDDIFLQNNLIRMYTKCRVLTDALKVFDEMLERNLVSWTLIISGAVQDDEFELGFKLYLDMTRTGLRPNEFAFGGVLKACSAVGAHEFGSCIHCLTIKIGMEKNRFVGSSILHMYAKSGDIEAAERVFEHLENLDTGCWNVMIGGYVECGHGFEVVSALCSMRCKGMPMDNYTFINALKGCSVMGNFDLGREIHGLMIRSNLELSASAMNSLMDLYFKIGHMNSAMKVFDTTLKDVISWNTLFSSFSPDGNSREVASLFHKLLLTRLKPNSVTFSILFRLCGEALDLDLGLQFYCLSLQLGFTYEANVVCSIISMFSRSGEMKMAGLVFDNLPLKSIAACNEMISGYISNCSYVDALGIFYNLCYSGVKADEYTFSAILKGCSDTENPLISRQIHGTVIKTGFSSNNFLCSSLIKGYVRLGLLSDSIEFFNGPKRLDLASWGVMFSELVHQGRNNEAIELLKFLIESGGKPDEFILGSILNGCASLAVYHQTKSVHSLLTKLGFEMHSFVVSATIDAYGKCGDVKSARLVFEKASPRLDDIVLFNSMIMAYAHHGLLTEAMEIFGKIKLANLLPCHSTFVSLLSACNHLGQVEQGHAIFDSISSCYKMQPSPDNYGCFVDMLARSGHLEDAKHAIQHMPFPPWPAILRSLLNGCRIHGNRELGRWAADKLFRLDPKNDAAYVLLSKVYSEDGSWENAAEVNRGLMLEGVRKEQGCSWIEL